MGIQRSQSILAESVMEASMLRDKQAIANQNMELTRKKQRERAKKKLARRLKARETAFVAPAVVHMVASPSPSPHLRENENGDVSNHNHNHNHNENDNRILRCVLGADKSDKENIVKVRPAQLERQHSRSGGRGTGSRISVRHSRSSIFKRRESAMLEHQHTQQIQRLSLENNDTNDNSILDSTISTSLESQFKPAKLNVLETQRRMSRRASGIVYDLVQAQQDAILQQQIELADRKTEMYVRLNARLKNRQLVDEILASSEEEDNYTSSEVDVASVESVSADGSIKDTVVVTKVIERKKKVRYQKPQKRKTKVTKNRNTWKTKGSNKIQKSKTSRKTKSNEANTTLSAAHLKDLVLSETVYDDEDLDEEHYDMIDKDSESESN